MGDDVIDAGAGKHEVPSLLPGRDLAWLISVMWPRANVRISPQRVPAGERVAEAYAVIPGLRRPRLLVPASSPSLAGLAIRGGTLSLPGRTSPWRTVEDRLRASALGWSRLPVLVVLFARDPAPDELLTNRVRAIFDRPDAELAIAFDGAGELRKPLVQVLTLDGELLGFGKVGWNASTQTLVANEVSAIQRWSRRRPSSFRVPELVHHGSWGDHALILERPISVDGRSARAVTSMPDAAITREIARAGGTGVMPLSSTPWWRSLLERTRGPGAPSVVLRWMEELHGRRLVWQGSWHGDWRPENLQMVGSVLHVRNWERARDGVPLGLDPIHFAFQTTMRNRRSVRGAARLALRRSHPTLRALGVPSGDDALLMACYLAELLDRLQEARRHGHPVRSALLADLTDELRRWVGES